ARMSLITPSARIRIRMAVSNVRGYRLPVSTARASSLAKEGRMLRCELPDAKRGLMEALSLASTPEKNVEMLLNTVSLVFPSLSLLKVGFDDIGNIFQDDSGPLLTVVAIVHADRQTFDGSGIHRTGYGPSWDCAADFVAANRGKLNRL